ncbi:MAG: FecR family protein, partial [Myxococcota bacterium]
MQRLSDGTRVLGLSESTRLRVDQREDIVEVTMEAGAADFDVPEDRQPWRPYRVRAHEVVVDVVGTRFTVAHQPPSTVRVRVVSGRVQVHSPDERVELTAGEHRQFPEPEPEVSVSASEPPPPKKRVSRRRAKTRLAQKNEPRPTWQALAEQGRFEEAARSLSRGGRV